MANEELADITSNEQQLVVFELAGESYGVDIGAVNAIIRMQKITESPGTPEFAAGVTDLLGSIIPVIDLRKRLGLTASEVTRASRIVIVEASGQMIGIVVDAVTETMRLSCESVELPSPIVTSVDSAYVRGVGKLENRLIILLDLAKILSGKTMDTLYPVDKAA